MEINQEKLESLSLADLIAIPNRSASFYLMDIYQYDDMVKVVKEEIHKRVTNIFIF